MTTEGPRLSSVQGDETVKPETPRCACVHRFLLRYGELCVIWRCEFGRLGDLNRLWDSAPNASFIPSVNRNLFLKRQIKLRERGTAQDIAASVAELPRGLINVRNRPPDSKRSSWERSPAGDPLRTEGSLDATRMGLPQSVTTRPHRCAIVVPAALLSSTVRLAGENFVACWTSCVAC
jgi:hypothetical protein